MIYDTIKLAQDTGVVGLPIQKSLTQPGSLTALVGKAKWVPGLKLNCTSIVAVLNTAGASNTTIDVKRNGAVIQTVIIPANSQHFAVEGTFTLEANDAVSVDVTVPGSGASDLSLHFNCMTV
jgi:hypothetical protein